jgi:hypothetical protein
MAGEWLRLTPYDGGPAVTGTMTWAATDVHARSTYAASMDVITGEFSVVEKRSIAV